MPDRPLTLRATITLHYLLHSGPQAFSPAGFDRPLEHVSLSSLQHDTASQIYGP